MSGLDLAALSPAERAVIERHPYFEAGRRQGMAEEYARHHRVAQALASFLDAAVIGLEDVAAAAVRQSAIVQSVATELRTRVVSAEEHRALLSIEQLQRDREAFAHRRAARPGEGR